jgi:hypothetical protein
LSKRSEEAARFKARVKAQGKDSKGRGGANANVDFHLEPSPLGTRVLVKTDLTLSGAVAQYGRASGMIQDVAQQLIGQFANNLKAQLAASQPGAGEVPPKPQPKPISGFALILAVLSNALRRLFGGKPS